jgi:hypothetical protein
MREISDGQIFREFPLVTNDILKDSSRGSIQHGDCIQMKARGVTKFGRVVGLSRHATLHVLLFTQDALGGLLYDFTKDELQLKLSDKSWSKINVVFEPIVGPLPADFHRFAGAVTPDGAKIPPAQVLKFLFELLPPGHMANLRKKIMEAKLKYKGNLVSSVCV